MIVRVVADAVAVVHLAFVLFVVFGGVAVMYRRWIALVHVPAACWGAVVALTGWTCPLTPLETALRRAAGERGYTGGFIEHYLNAILYPAGLTRDLQWLLGIFVVVLNLALYALVMHRHARS